MVNKQAIKKSEGGPPPVDESWWAAILTEEEGHATIYTPRPASFSVPESKHTTAPISSRPATVDWRMAQGLYEDDESICLKVTGFNRGGLLVEGQGLQGFVPISHLVDIAGEKCDADRELLLAAYVDRELRLKVIECDQERGRIVFSERAALAEPGSRNQLLDKLLSGHCVWGVVTNVTDFGVFVDLGGVEGLIHVSELSWGRVRHPSDAVSVGDQVEAFVINVDKERSRVALSLKRLRPNPWDTAEKRYWPGQVIEAVITSIVPFGAFARLEEGLDGLIHISEMGIPGDDVKTQGMFLEGQSVMVRVIHVDASKQRLGLSLHRE